ncbi:colanic acid exporter [Flavobacterium sp. ACN2]|jgi:O-antigen/teichoic acid export membrane protein|uniref:oligosaccharide flippase family protein n=1 Tax=unclassified Flavobacterium TaxID=196869 RepID=UPI000BB33D77|nr:MULTISPECIES: oligosaccharide flippase family protein [unclassified Flavobacterium]MDY0987392.1 oligosaccharide flippase family protein [Flavobacterium sp. CFBP9031]PBI84157.1 colanic acid exporter [Flavobacterium sp. ACN2]
MNNKEEEKDALKATGTVGGAQVINILISLLRTKVIALILGTFGVGVVGILTTATDMIRNFASLGLPFSGVRDISIANAKKDDLEISRIVKVFNKWIFISALVGSIITVIFCLPLSRFLFNNDIYTVGIGFLSVSVFFSTLAAGYQSVMQGKRAVLLMSKATIVANFFGSLVSVLFYLVLKDKGIVPSLILMALVNFLVIYFFYKKLRIPKYKKISVIESWSTAKVMIRIGFFTIIVSIVEQFVSLGLRAFLSNKSGIDGVGLFTAANTIATMYLSIVLNSMASDYYPKLSSIHDDNHKLGATVNNQLYIVLLLASPIIIGMVGFAEVAIKILYSSKFLGAVSVLKWQIIGDFFKIIAWPFGFVFLAKGLGKLFVFSNVSYTIIYIASVYLSWDKFGFLSIGLSFFIAQFFLMVFICLYSNFRFGINISSKNIKVVIVMFFLLAVSFCSHEYFTGPLRLMISVIALIFSIIYSIYNLSLIMDVKMLISRIIRRK